MSIIVKSVFLTLAVAVFGVATIRMNSDAIVSNTVVAAPLLPDANDRRPSLPPGSSSLKNGQPAADNFQKLQDHLEAARIAAEAMPGYTAILKMQEEVGDQLRSVDRIEFKTRREPFSVYMRWSDSGQEALYVDGENDNRVIVRPKKGLAAIRRVWRLEPDSRMAKQTCRYPITDVGIENLVVRVQRFYNADRSWPDLAECKFSESKLSDRAVTVVEVKFNDKMSVPEYCASKFSFDRESNLLVEVKNFGWTDETEPRLIEHYVYSEIEVNSRTDEDDFSEENPAYQFVSN